MRWRYRGRHRANRHSLRVTDVKLQLSMEQAARAGQRIAQRAIRFHGQQAGIAVAGLMETFRVGER